MPMEHHVRMNLVAVMATAPDSQIATPLTRACGMFAAREQTSTECVRFLRNLLDAMVHTGGGSTVAVLVVEAALHGEPAEDPAEQDARRERLWEAIGEKERDG